MINASNDVCGMKSFEVETGLRSLLKASTFLSCFPDLYRMEYRYTKRINAHRMILEGAVFEILLVSPNKVFKGWWSDSMVKCLPMK